MTNNSNATMSPSKLLERAFKSNDTADKAGAISTQSMVAGIYAYYAEVEGNKPTLGNVLAKGQAHDDFKDNMVAAMTKTGVITTRITAKEAKANKTKDIVVSDANNKNNTQMQKLTLAFKLAGSLLKAGITNSQYDDKQGLFMVPASMLIGGATPRTRLAAMVKAGERVALNGVWYDYEDDDTSGKFRALPAQVIKIATEQGLIPTLTKAPKATVKMVDGSMVEVSKGASDVDHGPGITRLLKSMTDAALEVQKTMDEEAPIPITEIDTDMLNAFTEMQIALDAWNEYRGKCEALVGATKKTGTNG
jgi:hypothetical protein